MAILQSNWTEETVAALEMRAEKEIRERREERVIKGELRRPKESLWAVGQRYALQWIKEDASSVPFKLQDYRQRLTAEFHYGDPKDAPKIRRRLRRNRNICRGVVDTLEQHCKEVGLHIPTQEEKDAEAIERLLAMEMEGALG